MIIKNKIDAKVFYTTQHFIYTKFKTKLYESIA